MSTAESYEEVPYPRQAHQQTHPGRLGAMATLLGMDPAPADACRVIELGCSTGDNLIPLAIAFPGSRFVGIDVSPRQIETGRAVAAELGLENLRLEARGLETLDDADGEFDFILSHGVYSWVPEAVRERMLPVCRERLSQNGVVLVSYNALPGWHLEGALRGAMLFHTRRGGPGLERVEAGLQLIERLGREQPEPLTCWAKLLRVRGEDLRLYPPAYVLHDHLEACNTPFWFADFAQRAAEAGLGVLGDARVAATWLGVLAPETRKQLEAWGSDPIEVQQYLDILVNRTLRQTLLCRDDVSRSDAPDPGRLRALHVASRQEPGEAEPALAAGLGLLSRRWPASLPFTQLCVESGIGGDATGEARLADALLERWRRDQIDLYTAALPVAPAVSERPESCAAARVLARDGGLVPSRLHASHDLSPVSRLVLRLLDGRRDREALLDALAEEVRRGRLVDPSGDPDAPPAEVRTRLAALLEGELARFARSGLLAA